MNKYTRLLSNTFLFAISTFSSKILVFLLMPFYTEILPPEAKATADLIIKSGNLVQPLLTLGIGNAVIRFGLDKACRRENVYTNAVTAIAMGSAVSLCFWPALTLIPDLNSYLPLLYVFMIVSVLRNSLSSNFVRSQMYTRLYAVDGVLNSALYVLFMILFLKPFGWGIPGFVLATIAADACSILFLTVVAGLHRYLKPRYFNPTLFKEMVRYSAPLIPSTMFWWIINTSDFYFVKFINGNAMAGLYSIAYNIPNLIMMFSSLFTEAWQLSAVTEDTQDKKARERFFSRVFFCFQGLVFSVSAGLIVLCKVCITVLAADAYYTAWQYVPLLILAMIFSCFVTFIGSIYMVEKRSSLSLYTMLVGAVMNLILNALLIPLMGPNGAAVATIVSYLTVFIIRAVNTKKYIRMKLHTGRIVFNLALLTAETLVMMAEPPLWPLYCGLLTLAVLAFNFSALWQSVKKLLRRGA